MTVLNRFLELPWVGKVLSYRFIRFGMVGLSGTVVNLGMLYLGQNFMFIAVKSDEMRLNISLALAIFLATLNNYMWNRWWTWSDRRKEDIRGFFTQMVQYYLACGVAILVQFVVTLLLAKAVNYLLANIVAIIFSAVFVFILNHVWTFRKEL